MTLHAVLQTSAGCEKREKLFMLARFQIRSVTSMVVLRPRQLSDCASDGPSNRRRQHRLAFRKSCEAQRHLGGEIGNGNTGSRNIIDVVGNQAKVLLSDSKPLTVGSIL